MASNRWYRNNTNIVLDLTGADAADIENKASDIANALDALEIEFDALLDSNTNSLKVDVAGESPNLTLTTPVAQRASRVLGFDSSGDLNIRTITSLEGLSFAFQTLSNGSTVTLNTETAYYLNLAPAAITTPQDISYLPIINMTLPAISTPVGSSILFATNQYGGFRVAKLSGAGQTIDGDSELIIDAPDIVFRIVKTTSTSWRVLR
jgi:hypothetical protein